MGTPDFISKEIVTLGQYTPEGDMYALAGLSAYLLGQGEAIYQRKDREQGVYLKALKKFSHDLIFQNCQDPLIDDETRQLVHKFLDLMQHDNYQKRPNTDLALQFFVAFEKLLHLRDEGALHLSLEDYQQSLIDQRALMILTLHVPTMIDNETTSYEKDKIKTNAAWLANQIKAGNVPGFARRLNNYPAVNLSDVLRDEDLTTDKLDDFMTSAVQESTFTKAVAAIDYPLEVELAKARHVLSSKDKYGKFQADVLDRRDGNARHAALINRIDDIITRTTHSREAIQELISILQDNHDLKINCNIIKQVIDKCLAAPTETDLSVEAKIVNDFMQNEMIQQMLQALPSQAADIYTRLKECDESWRPILGEDWFQDFKGEFDQKFRQQFAESYRANMSCTFWGAGVGRSAFANQTVKG